jgi:Cu+-exporting ATPase
MDGFYDLSKHPGARVRKASREEELAYLDEPKLQQRLLDFTDGKVSRVTLRIPAIHCIACVWLLENLFRLKPGIGRSRVNFGKREVAITFSASVIRLSQLVAFLNSLGYEPQLTLDELDKRTIDPARKSLWLRLGVAGFAFGNIMLFSLPGYLGLDSVSQPVFRMLFGVLSLGLALPVLIFSAGDYWKSAFHSFRQRVLTLDVPIAVGLAALYLQSAFEILSRTGEGYLDSLAGLVFFLLCGRTFQQKTFERMAFDRDYKCFFPLSANRKTSSGETSVSLAELSTGDRLLVRNGELIPADSKLISGQACIDYSFVTGESEPTIRNPGDHLYAGGKQTGSLIEVEIVKPVSQGYLTSLWNDEVFQKPGENTLDSITNRYSRHFTWIVLAVAFAAAAFWVIAGQTGTALKAFTSVLIVACPCALALAAPFTLGAAQRALARVQVFVKGTLALERLAQVNTVVFDKTGTLTAPEATVEFLGTTPLNALEAGWLQALAVHSTHPYSRAIAAKLPKADAQLKVSDFREVPGAGTSAKIDGHRIRIGSRQWVTGAAPDGGTITDGAGMIHAAIDGAPRGAFVVGASLRRDVEALLMQLGKSCDTILLSGDNNREQARFAELFGTASRLHFNQSPTDKLAFVRELQASGRKVMMVGDGLNDAGALKQSDLGVAVVERTGAFSPASDVVMPAAQVPQLAAMLEFARRAVRIVRVSFGISALYNLVGVSIASAGILSPLICAVLMPVSSISVVLFAVGATQWTAHRLNLRYP